MTRTIRTEQLPTYRYHTCEVKGYPNPIDQIDRTYRRMVASGYEWEAKALFERLKEDKEP